MNGATVFLTAIGYVVLLFLIAWWGDRGGRRFIAGGPRAVVYALSLAVYCTSWTYYGSVGLASEHGLDFLPIYIGPMLVIGLGAPFVGRIANLARTQNLTTVADFVSARYGKSQAVAAAAALIALAGSAPYVALQLKAASTTLVTVVASLDQSRLTPDTPSTSFTLAIALVLAAFAIAFGTRRINPKEHQDGLILAIAVELIVKLAAFLAVGAFVVWGLNGGIGDLTETALSNPNIAAVIQTPPDPAVWGVTTLLSAFAIVLLPRQFHVAVVENHDQRGIRTASWLFPAYLVLINLFVAPLAIAGLKMFPDGGINRDLTVLALPLAAGARGVALLTMIGGVSAATGMVVLDSLALAITISNDLVMPLLLRRRVAREQTAEGDIGALVLWVRRVAIVAILTLGFAYERVAGEAPLAAIGLLSFAAVAQIAPSFLGGLFWRRGTARGAIAGMIAGSLGWVYLLLLPSIEPQRAITAYLAHGPLAIAWLSPAALVAFAPNALVGGVVLSLIANIVAFVAFSLTRQPSALERTQASAFAGVGGKPQAFRLWRSSTTAGELEAAVARYLGAARARRAFSAFLRERGLDYDPSREASAQLIRHAEFLLSPAIGASTSRQVLSLLLRPRAVSGQSALKLIDEASAAIQSSRDQLQHALDHARQGITVFDFEPGAHRLEPRIRRPVRSAARRTAHRRRSGRDRALQRRARRLWAGRFRGLRRRTRGGAPVRGSADEAAPLLDPSGDRDPVGAAARRGHRHHLYRRDPDGSDRGGAGSRQRASGKAGRRAHRRVAAPQRRTRAREDRRGRGEPLQNALSRRGEPRHSAAAQRRPALRQFAQRRRLPDRPRGARRSRPQRRRLARGGRGDSRRPARHFAARRRGDQSRKSPTCRSPTSCACSRSNSPRWPASKGLELRFVPTKLAIRTDRRLMRRLLQNLVSNAIKYTLKGRVLVGCRRARDGVRIEVWDTGLGIPADRQRAVFEEFRRLDQGARVARGLGLGLSIVERLSRVLGHPVGLNSRPGEGSVFFVTAPLGKAAPTSLAENGTPRPLPGGEPLIGLKILAIDNEPRVLEGMRLLMSRWGCVIATAHGLAEAREALAAFGPPDVIIADYHLDQGDGIEAIRALRGDLGCSVPAILATADRSLEARGAAAAR